MGVACSGEERIIQLTYISRLVVRSEHTAPRTCARSWVNSMLTATAPRKHRAK